MRVRARTGGVALAVVLLVLAWATTWSAVSTRWGHMLVRRTSRLVAEIAPLRDLWVHLLRGLLGTLAIPALLVVVAVVLVVVLRQRRWRDALVIAVVWLGANGTVQAIKHGLLPVVPGHAAPVYSGHMAVTIGAAVALAVAVPARWRVRTIAWGAVAVVAMGVGILLTAWHTLDQVVAPTLIALAWTSAVLPFASRPEAEASL